MILLKRTSDLQSDEEVLRFLIQALSTPYVETPLPKSSWCCLHVRS